MKYFPKVGTTILDMFINSLINSPAVPSVKSLQTDTISDSSIYLLRDFRFSSWFYSELSSRKTLVTTWCRKFSSKDMSCPKLPKSLKWLNHISIISRGELVNRPSTTKLPDWLEQHLPLINFQNIFHPRLMENIVPKFLFPFQSSDVLALTIYTIIIIIYRCLYKLLQAFYGKGLTEVPVC